MHVEHRASVFGLKMVEVYLSYKLIRYFKRRSHFECPFFDKFYVNISVTASVHSPDLSLFTCRLPWCNVCSWIHLKLF